MVAGKYGIGATAESVALAGAGGNDLVANTSKLFTPPNGAMAAVIVTNAPASGVTIKVKWNAAAVVAAGVGGWDEVLAEGEVRVNPPGLLISKVALLASGNATNGTNFQIVGWT